MGPRGENNFIMSTCPFHNLFRVGEQVVQYFQRIAKLQRNQFLVRNAQEFYEKLRISSIHYEFKKHLKWTETYYAALYHSCQRRNWKKKQRKRAALDPIVVTNIFYVGSSVKNMF